MDWYPRFDGATVIFNSLRDGNAEIYSMNVDGTGVRRQTNNTVYDSFSQAAYAGAAAASSSGEMFHQR